MEITKKVFLCIFFALIFVGTAFAQPVVNGEVYNIACTGEQNGIIELTIVGDYDDIAWSTGESSKLIRNLAPGTYSVTVTNKRGLRKDQVIKKSFKITEPEPLALSIERLGEFDSAGVVAGKRVKAIVKGTTSPYQYIRWEGSSRTWTGSEELNLSYGDWTLVVVSQEGCIANLEFEITPTLPVVGTFPSAIQCVDDIARAVIGQPAVINILSNDTFTVNVKITTVSTPNLGMYSFDTDNNYVYTPNKLGTEVVTYTICSVADSTVCDTATISILVTASGITNNSNCTACTECDRKIAAGTHVPYPGGLVIDGHIQSCIELGTGEVDFDSGDAKGLQQGSTRTTRRQ